MTVVISKEMRREKKLDIICLLLSFYAAPHHHNFNWFVFSFRRLSKNRNRKKNREGNTGENDFNRIE